MTVRTSLSAPSMQTYFPFRKGFAILMTSAMITPVKRAVDTPAGPQEKPFDFLTWFCSFLRFPAQTKVIGRVTWSQSVISWRRLIVMGFSTRLRQHQTTLLGRRIRRVRRTPPRRIPSPEFEHLPLLAHLHGFGHRTTRGWSRIPR